MPSPQQRLSRFTRDPDAAASFQFTKRDLEILRHVAEHRFIRSQCLVKLVGGSRQQVLRRLHLLFHHGYLERPRAQLDHYHEGGSKCLVYGLASRGAGRLRRDLNMPFERMEWTTRNKRAGKLFVEHTLMVSDFIAALELACRANQNTRLIVGSELDNFRPLKWSVDLPGKRRVAIIPDKVCAIEIMHSDGKCQRTHFALEADTGTMPVERRDFRQSCVMRKLKAYEATVTRGIHRTQLKMHRLQIVILTSSNERKNNIVNATRKLGRNQLFRVHTDSFVAIQDMLAGCRQLPSNHAA